MVIRSILYIWLVTIAFLLWLFFSMSIGDTWGLEKKLSEIEKVIRVNGYKVYEGKASFQLVLNDGTIYLSNIGNREIKGSGNIVIVGIQNKKIRCHVEGTTVGIRGVNVNYLKRQYLPNLDLSTVQQVVNKYEQILEVFASDELLITTPPVFTEQENETRVCIKK